MHSLGIRQLPSLCQIDIRDQEGGAANRKLHSYLKLVLSPILWTSLLGIIRQVVLASMPVAILAKIALKNSTLVIAALKAANGTVLICLATCKVITLIAKMFKQQQRLSSRRVATAHRIKRNTSVSISVE